MFTDNESYVLHIKILIDTRPVAETPREKVSYNNIEAAFYSAKVKAHKYRTFLLENAVLLVHENLNISSIKV